MKVLKNYRVTKEKIEDWPIVKFYSHDEVFADLPIAVMEYGVEFETPVLYGNINGIPQILEKDDVELAIKPLKKFYFKTLEDGHVEETTPEEASIVMWLPKNTNVNELVHEKGELYWAKPINEGVEE